MEENRVLAGMDLGNLSKIPLTLELAEKVVKGIQMALYKGASFNSMDAFREAQKAVKPNGHYIVTEVRYGNDYMNSFLDITYPSEDTSIKRPTVIYTHGGGYFGGSKTMSDPLAVGDPAVYIFERIVDRGYNFVNVDYCLTPDEKFPVPLIQLTQAIDFLTEHAAEYGLDMTNVVVMGSSAGAILTGQYGALLANQEYRDLLNIYPKIDPKAVKALIVEDGPFIPQNFNWGLKVLLGNYCGTVDIHDPILQKYNAYAYFNEQMAPAFFDAGTIDGAPDDMRACYEKLIALGVPTELYLPEEPQPHGFVNQAKDNPCAAECFGKILNFMDKYTK